MTAALGTSSNGAATVSSAFAAALSAADLDAATACFARDACLITADATTIRGREDIRRLLAQLISMGPDAEVAQGALLVAGTVALASEHWTLRFTGPDSARFTQATESITVLRRVEDIWKLQISAPWGWG